MHQARSPEHVRWIVGSLYPDDSIRISQVPHDGTASKIYEHSVIHWRWDKWEQKFHDPEALLSELPCPRFMDIMDLLMQEGHCTVATHTKFLNLVCK